MQFEQPSKLVVKLPCSRSSFVVPRRPRVTLLYVYMYVYTCTVHFSTNNKHERTYNMLV